MIDVDTSEGGLRGRGEVRGFRRGRRRMFVQRLMDLGLTPGTKLTVVKSAPFNGPLEVLVRGSRIVLGRVMASRVIVEVTE